MINCYSGLKLVDEWRYDPSQARVVFRDKGTSDLEPSEPHPSNIKSKWIVTSRPVFPFNRPPRGQTVFAAFLSQSQTMSLKSRITLYSLFYQLVAGF